MTLNFWLKRLYFFIAIWGLSLIMASFVVLSLTNGINTMFWAGIKSIAFRGAINFSSYIIIFSIVIQLLSKRFPLNVRIKPQRLAINIITIFTTTLVFAKINMLLPFPESMIKPSQISYQIALAITFFQCGMTYAIMEIWEIALYNQSLSKSIIELEREKLKTQLLALQQQVNPHFLFNSLNALSELMHEDLEKADEFVAHFSNVYRYVLEINDESVVTLKQELAFLESYVFLQKIRFGDNLEVSWDLSKKAVQAFIPPLSLQLLFENAIKHNTISTEHPLKVQVKDVLNKLLITNNLQTRKTIPKGTGTGLNNLKEKYRLISNQIPEFKVKDGQYIASIPLLNLEA